MLTEPPADYGDLLMVSCATCGRDLLGESNAPWRSREPADTHYPPLAVRLGGRPYCPGCANVKLIPPGRGTPDDVSPWQENAIRDMEEGGGS